MTKLTINANLPLMLKYGDYHDIIDAEILLTKIFGNKIKCEEITSEVLDEVEGYYCYLALFYVGRRPSQKTIRELFKTVY